MDCVHNVLILFFFFFSSRRRHTRSDRDWSSDVCSSDLGVEEGGRGALKRSLDAGRHVQILLDAVDGVNRVAERSIGSKVERERDHGKLTLVVQCQRGGAGLETRERAEGNLRAVGGFYVNVFQRIGVLLELRIHFDDDVILVQLSKDGGDQALAESVIKCVVDIGGENAEARSGNADDGGGGGETPVQLVAGDIAKGGECF